MNKETVTNDVNGAVDSGDKPLLLTVKDCQEETQFSRTVIYALIASGEIPHIRCGRSLRIRRSDLLAWINGKTVGK
jgi:excisionase family DNA binding protein